jgi:hypothetical protein
LWAEANHPIQMSSTHGMGAREREDGKRRLRCPRLETVHEGHESDEQSLDWWPNPRHAGEALAWSARVSSPDKPRKPTDNKVQGSDAGRTYYLAMARSIRARQAAAAAERDGASARDTTSESDSRKQSEPAKTKPPEQPRMADLCAESPSDGRPVRGVATIQAHLSRTAEAKSVLLVVSRGTLLVQTLQKPYRQLMELPLGDVAAKVVPGHENMFLVTIIGSHPDAAGLVVVLRDRSLRDRWLQALATAGGHVDVAGSCLTASAGETSYPDAPVRWLR